MNTHLDYKKVMIPNKGKEETVRLMVLATNAHLLFNLEGLDALCHWQIGHNKYGIGNCAVRRRQSSISAGGFGRIVPLVY